MKDGADQMLALLTAAGYEVHGLLGGRDARLRPGGYRSAEPIFRLAAANVLQVRHLKQSVPTLEDAFAAASSGAGADHPSTTRGISATPAAAPAPAPPGRVINAPASTPGARGRAPALLLLSLGAVPRACGAGLRGGERRPRSPWLPIFPTFTVVCWLSKFVSFLLILVVYKASKLASIPFLSSDYQHGF